MDNNKFSRRKFIRNTSLLAAGAMTGSMVQKVEAGTSSEIETIVKNGRINQSVSRWCYNNIELDKFCADVKKMGLKGIDLMRPNDFPTLKKHGLVCTMVETHELSRGLADKSNHESCIAQIREAIDAAAENGFPNVISFPGNRGNISDEEGAVNSIIALKEVAGQAEEKKVTICLEYLNSKVNHKGYMFDNMKWGVDVCKGVGSERVKILYDIYHAQIMEGDIIRTIRDNSQYIGHYHTGGNPGRKDIDETQELYYPAIMKAIVETGFKGYVAHEFTPKNGMKSLARAVEICDV